MFNKKPKDKSGPSRFLKEILTIKSKFMMPLTHKGDRMELPKADGKYVGRMKPGTARVLIIGSSTLEIDKLKTKEMNKFFDRFLYFPHPDYSTRALLFRHFITMHIKAGFEKRHDMYAFLGWEKIGASKSDAELEEAVSYRVREVVDSMDVSSLAFVSEFYSTGAIKSAIEHVVTSTRVKAMGQRPLHPMEFVDSLAVGSITNHDDIEYYLGFMNEIEKERMPKDVTDKKSAGKAAKGGKK
jgi:hypothetical protein